MMVSGLKLKWANISADWMWSDHWHAQQPLVNDTGATPVPNRATHRASEVRLLTAVAPTGSRVSWASLHSSEDCILQLIAPLIFCGSSSKCLLLHGGLC